MLIASIINAMSGIDSVTVGLSGYDTIWFELLLAIGWYMYVLEPFIAGTVVARP